MNANGIQPRQILIVDDEPLVRQTVQMLLHCDGHVVVDAAGGTEALELFKPGKFDLVFTDYCMPAMKGDELAAAIKKLSPRQPVVMLTAYPEKIQTSNRPLPCIDSLVGKPFDLESLREAIDRCAPVQGNTPL